MKQALLIIPLVFNTTAQAQSLDGVWAPNPDACFTDTSDGDMERVTFGKQQRASSEGLSIALGMGVDAVSRYEYSCTLQRPQRRRTEITFSATCESEGRKFSGTARAAFENQFTVRVALPQFKGEELLVRCGQLTRKDIQEFMVIRDGTKEILSPEERKFQK